MATFANKLKRNSSKILTGLMLAGALGASGAVSAASMDVLNFQQAVDSPFLFNGDHVKFGNFWVETYSGVAPAPGDDAPLAATIIDGSAADQCYLQCPVNNKTNYLGVLDDGYFFFGMNDNSLMHVTGLSASFIATDQTTLPSLAGLLVLQGFNANGTPLGSALQVPLSGFSKGVLNFTSFNLPVSFSNNAVSFVRVLGYACDSSSNCSRANGLSNFAVDDIRIPEPASLALFGLAGVGMFAVRRRRAA